MRKFIFISLFSLVLSATVRGATFTVTSLTGNASWDSPTANNGSFAGAILAVNAAGAGPHTIAFNVPAPYTINIGGMTAALNANSNILIDGFTQTGSTCNTAVLIAFDQNWTTFTFSNQTNLTLRGLRFNSGLVISGGSGVTIQSCFFGLSQNGTATAGSVVGNAQLEIVGHSGAIIGGSAACQGNVFSGSGASSSFTSSLILNNSSSANISYNYFSTERTGLTLLGGVTGSAIAITGSASPTISNNVICGAVADKGAIEFISGTSNGASITSNFIGVNRNGVFANATAPNRGNAGHGILVTGGTTNTMTVSGNVISANGQNGILVSVATTGLNINNNTIGTSGSGIIAGNYGNGVSGIALTGTATSLTINQNLISRNTSFGITLAAVSTCNITNNLIGVRGTGLALSTFGNGDSGIRFAGASYSGVTVDNNVVCSNGFTNSIGNQASSCGIIFNTGTVSSATISNNYVGVDKSFNLGGNLFAGIYFFSCGNMGGSNAANVVVSGNVMGDNGNSNSSAMGFSSHGFASYNSNYFTLTGNYIGVGTGGQNIGNYASGMEINQSTNFFIRNNSISYNKGQRTSGVAAGIVVTATASVGVIQGNIITSNTNSPGFTNNHGIAVERSTNVLIGGTGAGEPNNISNNGTHGIFVLDNADNVEIRRNVIACNNSMGISLNIAGDPNTDGTKAAGNGSYAAPGPLLSTSGCPGAGNPGSGDAGGSAPANSLVEIFETPACKTCTTTPGSVRGEASAYQQQVTATAGGTWSATGVVGTVSVTATSPTFVTASGLNFRKTSRFSICEVCSLPIELLFFQAKRNGEVVLLTWATATEENNKFFTIERSENGKDFYPIGVVEGAGNSSAVLQYSFTDQQPLFTGAYYRLRQQDIDGQQSLSSIAYVAAKDLVSISVFPNPAQSQVTVVLPASGGEYDHAVVRLYNVLGQELLSVATSPETLSTGVVLDLSSVPAGTYTLKVANAQQDWVEQLVKK